MNLVIFITIFQIVQINFLTSISLIQKRHWISSCSSLSCTSTFAQCMNCSGQQDCKSCLMSTYPECNNCINDIFKVEIEFINGLDYLICDPQESYHQHICHFHCRGQFKETGKCVRQANIPLCQCSASTKPFDVPNISFEYVQNYQNLL